MEVREITPTAIELWLEEMGRQVEAGAMSPHTANGYFAILRVILRSAWKEFDLRRDPTAGVEPLDTSDWVTHSAEERNSLLEEEVQRFLARMKEIYPKHFAFVCWDSPRDCGRRRSALCVGRDRPPTSSGLEGCCSCGGRKRGVMGRCRRRNKGRGTR